MIDQTEALVAIDVNSGKNRSHSDAETTAFKINQEAAEEISRQLRLRDLGGVIIIDFIDMLQEKHRRGIERLIRELVTKDRAKTKILRISQFGIVEMTRQRMRPSFEGNNFMDCPHCKGSGMIKTPESMSIEIIRRIQSVIENKKIQSIEVVISAEVVFYLQNSKRTALHDLEKKWDETVVLRSNSDFCNDEVHLTSLDNRGSEVKCNY